MLLLHNRLYPLIEKYKDKIIKGLQNIEFEDTNMAVTHTKLLALAGQGDSSAQKYVIELIDRLLKTEIKIEAKDLQTIKDVVREEYSKLTNKTYHVFDESSSYINYYQLLDNYMPEEYRVKINNLDLNKINGLSEFIEVLYSFTYGNNVLDPLLKMKINNIEVHGTRRIRIETNNGVWKSIENYRFKTDQEIVKVARGILAGDNKQDLTEENCELEGSTINGFRITIALKPAAEEHMIFIKKFDAFKANDITDLVKVGEITEEMLNELKIYAKGRANIAVIGGVNSGKTTFLKSYVGLIPEEYKIGIIESDFETHFIDLYPDKDVSCLRETSKFSLNYQFQKQLRMNRDILAIGEARGEEVEQWIKGCTRGADGSFTTLHSRNAYDLINNLCWMALEGNGAKNIDIRLLRYRIACAVDIVIRIRRFPDGKRIVDRIDQIVPIHDNLDMPYRINTIYQYDRKKKCVNKVGNITDELAEKFAYYNCSEDEIESIIKPIN